MQVSYPDGDVVEYKLKYTTNFGKIYKAIADAKGIAAYVSLFLHCDVGFDLL